MNRPFISIIIPCYNVEEYLDKCIVSLSRQKNEELEFIFINDGSQDDTLQVLRDFEKSDRRVTVINKENGGVSQARNDGIKIAKGDYIYFLDGDDFLDEDFSERILEIVRYKDIDCLIFDFHFYDGEKQMRSRLNIPVGTYNLTQFLDVIQSIPISPKLYKRSILISHSIFFDDDLIVGEVLTFFVHYLCFCSEIEVVDACFYNYYMRENSATHKVDCSKDIAILNTVRKLEFYAEKYNQSILDARFFKMTVARIVYSFTLVKYIKNRRYSNDIHYMIKSVIKSERFKKYVVYFAYIDLRLTNEKLLSILSLFSVSMCYYTFSFLYRIKKIIKVVKIVD